eukprot:gene6605-7671_t
MKSIFTICALLVLVSVASAHFSPDFSISTRVVGSWTDETRGNCVYTQYDITFQNNSPRNVNQFHIAFDGSLRLRDNSDSSLWGVVRNGGDLVMPAPQTVNSHASYTFGFIIESHVPANLYIRSVDFC